MKSKIFNKIAKQHMKEWDYDNFKKHYSTLHNVIMQSMAEFKSASLPKNIFLCDNIFVDIIEFNNYIDARLHDNVIITPISVIPQNNKLWIFYTGTLPKK